MSSDLVRLRPREEERHISRNRTSLITGRDGFIHRGTDEGLFVLQTRTLSHFRYLLDEKPPYPVALSNVSQHTWLGYYVAAPSGTSSEAFAYSGQGEPRAAQQAVELRLSRVVGDGLHEDIDVTNYNPFSYHRGSQPAAAQVIREHLPEILILGGGNEMTFLPSMPDANLLDVFKRWPEIADRWQEYTQQVMRGPSPLTGGERELIAAYVSRLNGCGFVRGLAQTRRGAIRLRSWLG